MKYKTLLGLCLLLILTTGCATSNYLTNRKYDAMDIVTLTGGVGYGAKARVGPIQAPAVGYMDFFGLRNIFFIPVKKKMV